MAIPKKSSNRVAQQHSLGKRMTYKMKWVPLMETLAELDGKQLAEVGASSFGANVLLW